MILSHCNAARIAKMRKRVPAAEAGRRRLSPPGIERNRNMRESSSSPLRRVSAARTARRSLGHTHPRQHAIFLHDSRSTLGMAAFPLAS